MYQYFIGVFDDIALSSKNNLNKTNSSNDYKINLHYPKDTHLLYSNNKYEDKNFTDELKYLNNQKLQ
jgi:hypothetical protein